jgi:hypothetical protein
MPTYIGNMYEILSQIRYGLNEYSTALVQGTVTTGAWANEELTRAINNSQNHIWSILFEQFPEYFMKSASIVFTSSVATLPSDCYKIKEISNSDGCPLSPMGVEQRHIHSGSGSKYGYYRYGSTIRIDQDNVSDTGTIWYYWQCRELDTGMTSAGGAASATLATTSKAIVDYYNGMRIENVTDSTVDTITDYSAARVAVVSNTWAASKYYGIISELPTIFHPLIPDYALIQLKKNPKSPEGINVIDIQLFDQMLSSSMKSFAGTQNTDYDLNDAINDFG